MVDIEGEWGENDRREMGGGKGGGEEEVEPEEVREGRVSV